MRKLKTKYEYIKVEKKNKISIITLNRPKSLNALNRKMIYEIVDQLEKNDYDSSIRLSIIKGNKKAFAAGADIEEMMEETPLSFELTDPFSVWDRLMSIRKPIIASVSGYALGGGFELALHCDMIIASEDARFGFPEVNLGVMPGAGGTQLLTKIIGKRQAFEWISLGKQMKAQKANELGIVNKVVSSELLEEETIRIATSLANQPPIAVRLIKEAVNIAEDTTLRKGLKLERKNFYLTFDSYDQKEGMKAFIEKRSPNFKGK